MKIEEKLEKEINTYNPSIPEKLQKINEQMKINFWKFEIVDKISLTLRPVAVAYHGTRTFHRHRQVYLLESQLLIGLPLHMPLHCQSENKNALINLLFFLIS